MSKKRVLYLDYMRVIAMFAVVVLHVSGLNWGTEPVNSVNWQILNAFDGIVRFCVPVFIMISGALFLDPDKEINIKTLFSHNILRIVTSFALWTVIYAIICTLVEENNRIDGSVVKYFLASIIYGHYHMWFLYAIVGLYLITPFLRKITEDKTLTEYFIVLAIIFASFVKLFVLIPALDEVVSKVLDKTKLCFVLGYSCYYVLGYYIHKYELESKVKKIIYILGTFGIIITIVGNAYLSLKTMEPVEVFYDYMMPNVLFASIMVFVFIKDKFSKCDISSDNSKTQFIVKVSQLTFGMYLVHDLFLMLYRALGFTTTVFSPLIVVPLLSIVVFGLSYLVSLIISKIPVLRKYIM